MFDLLHPTGQDKRGSQRADGPSPRVPRRTLQAYYRRMPALMADWRRGELS